jgi:GAF domain-containing protein
VLDEYVQQWSAIQALRAANLSTDDIVMAYITLTGAADALHINGYLSGMLMLPTSDRNLVAQAINESLDWSGSTVDGAHYSDQDVTLNSGYEEYLRTLSLTPDGYDFTALPVGDHTTASLTTPKHDSLSEPSSSALYTQEFDPYEVEDGLDGLDGLDEEDEEDELEFRRVHALYESGLLESGTEERFDRLTRQAQNHFRVSSASIALITEDTQVIKSVTGPLGHNLPRSMSLCALTITQGGPLIIPDASRDPDWRDHPLVAGGPKVRFYAGHPVSTADGWRIGTLCLMDDRPRSFTENDAQVLRRLAMQVQFEIWI